jgi:RHS repeat-associated protein
MSADIGFDSQVPSLPQGGGAIGGLGETFSADLCMGTGNFTVPLDCPNGPNDIGPRLMLSYNTSRGNGPFGMGFAVPLPRLLRSTANKYPLFTAADTLMLEGVGELIAIGGGLFRPQVDGGAWRAQVEGDGFRLTDSDGLYYFLGTTPAARLADSAGTRVYAWHLERVEDALGNSATFEWQRDENQLYLEVVSYGGYEVRFHYQERPDPFRWGRAGFSVLTGLRCDRIELHLPGDPQPLLRRWTLGYTQGANNCSLLTRVTVSGFDTSGQALDAPALSLGYTEFKPRALTRFQNADDGAPPGSLNRADRRVELIDWNGDGLPDLLEIAGGGRARVWPNLGDCTWGRPQVVGDLPLFASPDAPVGFADMNGDGVADLIRLDQLIEGFVPRTPGGGFARPVQWRRAPAVSAAAPNTRLVDLDGDGISDLLSSSDDYLALYYRSEVDGWNARPQTVPRSSAPNINLADQHIFLADMTGDGAQDIVRVNGRDVTYFHYLGLGRWDEPITMEHSPELPYDFQPSRLLVSDIDGDGCADLVYLDKGRVLYWLNHQGIGFSDANEINYVPTGQIGDPRVADMRGSGAPGLLWSTPGAFDHRAAYFYLDFSGDNKAYLLNRIDNGLGLTTEITYDTSARQAASAKREGDEWKTFLPIPIPVVGQIAAKDAVTGRVATNVFRYFDGRYDGVLREFAGFGRVIQDQLGDETAPTLRVVTWFHVGVDPTNMQEPTTIELRKHLRALRGRSYRKERLGLDGSPQENLPYDRVEQTWTVISEQTPGGIVDIPRLLTTTRTQFEREPDALAIIATANTQWDAFGNVTETVETASTLASPNQGHTLRTVLRFAEDPAGRFRSRVWRVQQFDGADTLIADRITLYDDMQEGSIGAHGLITKSSALVLSDPLVTGIYGNAVPNFAAFGYHRRPNEDGWWIDQAAYRRTEDATGLHGQVTGPMGGLTTFDFDTPKMFPTQITDAGGNTSLAQHNYRICRVAQLTDVAGMQHLAFHDSLARLVAIVEPGDSVTLPTAEYDYETGSLPVSVSTRRRAESGNAATIDQRSFFDGSDALIEERVRDDEGEIVITSLVYSARGLRARDYLEHRPNSATYVPPDNSIPHKVYSYDALARLIRVRQADGSVREATYKGLQIIEADEEDTRTGTDAQHAGTPTRVTLDATGRVQLLEENLVGRRLSSHYEYDVKGNLILHTDVMGNEVSIGYDLLGRCLRIDRPEQVSIVVLDAAGNAVESRRGADNVVLRDFDQLNRLIVVRYNSHDTEPVQRFVYHDSAQPAPPDAGKHTNGGRLVRTDDEGGTTIYDYDERGRITFKRYTPLSDNTSYNLNFEYRTDGQLVALTYPESGNERVTLRYTHNTRGQLAAVASLVDSIEYDLAGRRTRVMLANGTEQTYSFDLTTQRLSEMQLRGTADILRALQYHYDLVGNLIRIDSTDSKLAASYGYDDLYRLTNVEGDSGESWTYLYDDVGNLTFKSDIGEYRYGETGAPATCLTSAGDQTFTYSPRGEMEQTPWGTLSFNPDARLVRIVFPRGAEMILSYNHAGVRVAERGSSDTTAPVNRLTPDALYSIDNGALILNLFDGQGTAARLAADGTRLYFHPDHLGSLALVTDETGQVVEARRYDPFGKLLEPNQGAQDLEAGFAGGMFDPWSGLTYLSARYYHPALGRFISPDNVVQHPYEPATWTPYTYCRNNPLRFTDPSGLSFWTVLGGTLGFVGLVALSVVTAGAATPLAIAVGTGEIAGGVVGALATAQRGGDVWETAAGALVGAAVGGWGAFGAYYAGSALMSLLGPWSTFVGAVSAGGLSGAITGASIGFASGFAGGLGTLDDIWDAAGTSALVGAFAGAMMGTFASARAAGIFGAADKPLYYHEDVSWPKVRTALELFAVGASARILLTVLTKEHLTWGVAGQTVLAGLATAGFSSIISVNDTPPEKAELYTATRSAVKLPDVLAPLYIGATSSVLASVSSATYLIHSDLNPASLEQLFISAKGY